MFDKAGESEECWKVRGDPAGRAEIGGGPQGWADSAMEDLGQLQAPVKPVKRENTYITEPNGYGEVRDSRSRTPTTTK